MEGLRSRVSGAQIETRARRFEVRNFSRVYVVGLCSVLLGWSEVHQRKVKLFSEIIYLVLDNSLTSVVKNETTEESREVVGEIRVSRGRMEAGAIHSHQTEICSSMQGRIFLNGFGETLPNVLSYFGYTQPIRSYQNVQQMKCSIGTH
ncbi:hypothetical protein Scep_019114 [Stephania cephalantha]|uniref:Uncharacterized protein n=1 Tax=Stephania cephalantha TaxID=152367 RepID=A0AAP0NMY2_9MAGN